jgi:hypothetical protein
MAIRQGLECLAQSIYIPAGCFYNKRDVICGIPRLQLPKKPQRALAMG